MVAVVVYEERKALVEIVLIRVSSKQRLVTVHCKNSGREWWLNYMYRTHLLLDGPRLLVPTCCKARFLLQVAH